MSLQQFKVLKRLGEGAYSSVYSVLRLSDGQQYALKKVKMGKLSDKEKENALNEVRILASITHNNICSYNEAFMDEGTSSLCIIMEYANNGDLFQKITRHQKESTYLREEDIWSIFIQLVKGLKALHDIDIFHRDLKSANVFLHKDGTAKLGDMNVSKVAKRGLLYTQTGTPYYASPEVWRDQPYDMKSDIWSLGCVLYESITLRPPFRADDMAGLYRKVLRGVYSNIPDHFSPELAEVTKALVQVQPGVRPSCEEILNMPAVIRMGEQLFMDDFYEDQARDSSIQNELLSTIRVPKNLLYLTDRLPQARYDDNIMRNRSTEEESKYRLTHEISTGNSNDQQQRLPSIPRQQGKKQSGSKQGQGQPPLQKQRSRDEEIAQSQSLPNLDKQRPQQKVPNQKHRNLKRQSPPLQQQTKSVQEIKSGERGNDREQGSPGVTPGETISQRSLNIKVQQDSKARDQQRAPPKQPVSKKASPVVTQSQVQQQSKNIDSVTLSIQGENTQKQAARKAAHPKAQSRTNSQVQQHQNSPQNKDTGKVRRQSRESVNEYEADEFEKEDLVQMGEPQKPIIRQDKGRNQNKMQEKATNDTITTRAGVSESNSLMREISVRKNKEDGGQSGMPQLKQVNRSKGLNRNESKDTLVVSARETNSPNKDSISSVTSQQNHNSQRGLNPIYKSQGQQPLHGQNIYERGHQPQVAHHIQRKPRVNYPGNMAYINISSDGQRLVGPLGLKKAEQELIKRRYKYSYNNQDSISRVALVYGQHSGGGSVGHRDREHLHGADGMQNQYQTSSRAGGASGVSHRSGNAGQYYVSHGSSNAHQNHNQGVSPYLQYTRDIQNMYRRQKAHPNESGLPKLPRINNQREILNQVNRGLPPIQVQHGLGSGSQLGTGRNHGPSPLMYNGTGGQGSYRNLKGRTRGIGQSVLADGQVTGTASHSVDRHADIQASLNAMQIQSQPRGNAGGSLQKKATLQKRLEPISVSSVTSPQNHMPDIDKRLISPSYLPKSTTSGKAAVQIISNDQK